MSAIDVIYQNSVLCYGLYTHYFTVYEVHNNHRQLDDITVNKGDICLGGGSGEHSAAIINLRNAIELYFNKTVSQHTCTYPNVDDVFRMAQWGVREITGMQKWKVSIDGKEFEGDHDFIEYICVSLILCLNEHFPERLKEYTYGEELVIKSEELDYDYSNWENKLFHPLKEWLEDDLDVIERWKSPNTKDILYLKKADHREEQIDILLDDQEGSE